VERGHHGPRVLGAGLLLSVPTVQPMSWPEGGLEHCAACPACSATTFHPWLAGLPDRVFATAPGLWNLHRCERCGSAFLDPRPTPETVGMAYAEYYTHDAPALSADSRPRGLFSRARRSIRNGYLNRSFGLDLPDAWAAGSVIARLAPPLARRAREWAQLPRPRAGARLLDVGAASGGSVAHLLDLGWRAEGIDVDERAVAQARTADIPVRVGRIEQEDGSDEFDAITFDHSIEHLHDPGSALESAFRLLRPGGTAWIATPNLGSLGRKLYGLDWIGLDPPRHLVLFTASGLRRLLLDRGFEDIRFHPPRIGGKRYWYASQALRAGHDVWEQGRLPFRARVAFRLGESRAGVLWNLGEELLVTAARTQRPAER
jgi:SAM-dependent methyltransferase